MEHYPTKYWQKLPDGKVQCEVCPRACTLQEGQAGLCFVRARHNNQIVLTTYGRSSGFCIDPIEKKPLNHFLPGSSVLSFGTAGCNLTCKFCQNWDISKSRETDTLAAQASPELIVKAALKLNCQSIAFTYNDPVVFMEYAIDVAKLARSKGIKTVAVTAGYMNAEPRAEFYQYMDAANVDLKAFSEKFYKQLCSADLTPVLETLCFLKKETKVWLEITTLLIPSWNDSASELESLCRWILENLGPDVPLHFSAFHPDYKLTEVEPTPPQTLGLAREIGLRAGLHYVYTGNVHDPAGQSTYCTKCGGCVIKRDWYQIGSYNLDQNGCCAKCAAPCAGVFGAAAGSWGNRRQAVNLGDFA
jgi:pyruvate formate lyase activating enzyme